MNELDSHTPKELIEAYVGLRDLLQLHESNFKTWKENIKSRMEELQQLLFAKMQSLDVEQLKSSNHIAFKTSREYLNISDKQAFTDYVLNELLTSIGVNDDTGAFKDAIYDSGALDLISIKAAKTSCRDVMQEKLGGKPVPGTNYTSETVINIRKG